jgi:hypothetical protein
MRDDERPPVLAHVKFQAERESFAGLDLAARFQRIHATNLWGANSSRSGLGSEQPAASALQRDLPGLLRRLGVRSLLDAPCGDASWINRVDLGVEYTGADIVPELIDDLAQRAATGRARGRYVRADITKSDLPAADAILCRDCLVHLSFANIGRTLANFRRSSAVFLIATTFPDLEVNQDCEDGDWRALNMQRPPFACPAPLELLNEGCDEAGGGYRDKSLGVWRLANVAPTRV